MCSSLTGAHGLSPCPDGQRRISCSLRNQMAAIRMSNSWSGTTDDDLLIFPELIFPVPGGRYARRKSRQSRRPFPLTRERMRRASTPMDSESAYAPHRVDFLTILVTSECSAVTKCLRGLLLEMELAIQH